jgi:hypothetical protein
MDKSTSIWDFVRVWLHQFGYTMDENLGSLMMLSAIITCWASLAAFHSYGLNQI